MVKKAWRQISVMTLVILLLTGCGSLSSTPDPPPTSPPPLIPTQLPQPTPTLAVTAVTVEIVAQPTEEPTEESATTMPVCANLADELTQVMGTPATAVDAPFQDWNSGNTFDGCQTAATATGQQIADVVVFQEAVTGMMAQSGWVEDSTYAGGGPGAMLQGYRLDEQLCLVTAAAVPASEDLCPDDVPVFVCWEDLTPDQKHYTTTINCSGEVSPLGSASSQPTRIEFEPGATSGRVTGTLTAGGMAQYVLWARAGQEMQVGLTGVSPDEALLIIWGEDGTVLISSHATTQSWQGELPITQDYFIDVRASATAETVAYTLEIVIPPE